MGRTNIICRFEVLRRQFEKKVQNNKLKRIFEQPPWLSTFKFILILLFRGISGMELVACDLMKKKAFLSRQLSQDGVVNVVSICKTNKNSEMIYQASVEMVVFFNLAKFHQYLI